MTRILYPSMQVGYLWNIIIWLSNVTFCTQGWFTHHKALQEIFAEVRRKISWMAENLAEPVIHNWWSHKQAESFSCMHSLLDCACSAFMPHYQYNISLVSERKHTRVTWAGINLPTLENWVTPCEKQNDTLKWCNARKTPFSHSRDIVTTLHLRSKD